MELLPNRRVNYPPMKSLRKTSRSPDPTRSRRTVVRARTARTSLPLIAEHVNHPVTPAIGSAVPVLRERFEVGTARLGGAVVAGIGGFLIVGLLGWRAFDLGGVVTSDFRIFIIIVLAKTATSLALSYLAYTLFSAAERLLLPQSLLKKGGTQVSLVRAVLGIRSPLNVLQSFAARLKKNLLGSQSCSARITHEQDTKTN